MKCERQKLEQDLAACQAAIAAAERVLDSARETISRQQIISGKIIDRLLAISMVSDPKPIPGD